MSVSPRRHVLSVPAHSPFLKTLAEALIGNSLFAGTYDRRDPLALARVTVLLPTRRACRELAAILADMAGPAPLLLPRIRALGTLDEAALAADPQEAGDYPSDSDLDAGLALAPAMGAMQRQLILARAIHVWGRTMAPDVLKLLPEEAPVIPGSPAHAVHLAADLARLMDQMESEEVSFDALAGLDVGEHARFWQIALEFLSIMTAQWPAILAERGLMAPVARRNALIDAEAQRLARLRPEAPVIAAGSTGSVPATARLLGVIASLPQGAVVLPGLDLDADEQAWAAIAHEDAASHPQHGMALLLNSLGMQRREVLRLGDAAPAARLTLVDHAMRPAAETARWHEAAGLFACGGPDPLHGVTYVEAATSMEEATVIALMLREVADDETRSAALVTPDRALARRVAAELARFGVLVDDSAGVPLAATPAGVLARHAAGLMGDGFLPVPLMALLKHPLCLLGLEPGAARAAARALELGALRGRRPEASPEGVRRALAGAQASPSPHAPSARLKGTDWAMAHDLLDRLERALAPVHALAGQARDGAPPLSTLLAAHLDLVAALSADARGQASALAGDDGMALAEFFQEAMAGGDEGLRVPLKDYPALFAALVAGRPVRATRPAHPRLHILGLLEARLLHVDRIVLGGLNEGVWPQEPGTDPWLSRSLRRQLGLQSPERRIGLAAHDFVQAFGAGEVFLTRAARAQGAPCVPSRWLLRLEALLKAAGRPGVLRVGGHRWLALARALDRSAAPRPIAPPRPMPPPEARPRRLSVTQVETWLRDPYAIYARHVLRLAPLEALDAPFEARDRGTVIHEALKRFMDETGGVIDAGGGGSDDAVRRLDAIGAELFAALTDAPEVRAFWQRRFARAARWFVAFQRDFHKPGTRIATEIDGALAVAGDAFTVTARADRIDRHADGGVTIIDYKSGTPPSKKDVERGLAAQLPLETAILAGGGFAGIPAGPVAGLAYMQISGGTPPGRFAPLSADLIEAARARALDGLIRRVAAFQRQDTPYLSHPHPSLGGWSDYDHLARVREWSRDAGLGE